MASHAPQEKVANNNTFDQDNEKSVGTSPAVSDHGVPADGYETDNGSTHKQAGVKRVEAITSVQSKKDLWLMFILLYLVSFVDMLMVSIQYSLNVYVYSEFAQHGLVGAIGIVATIAGGVSSFTIAKIIDIWGRLEGYLLMLLIVIIGMVMKAACQNVETYAAAHTFYWVGHLGLLYVIDITIADMTTLRNRMIILTLNGTPGIAGTFAGPEIATRFLEKSVSSGWRTCFWVFAIVIAVVALPAAVLMFINQLRAKRAGLLVKNASGRTPFQTLKYYATEFDVFGLLLVTAAFSLFLLPFSLYGGARGGWRNGSMIAMLVLGVFFGAVFVVWEAKFAPVQFFPFRYLKDRTVIGSCLLYGTMFLSVFTWDTYYYSYLQIAHDLPVTSASYTLNAFSLTSQFISPFVGWAIRSHGNINHIAWAGIPFVVLGTTLLVHFRTPETHVGYLVMCQVFMGIGSGIWATTAQLAIMASVTHQEIAVAVALWGMFGSIGSAIGQTIAGALWTNVVPQKLFEFLPEGSKDLAPKIYTSLVIQSEYPVGTPIRDAINLAYGDVQRKMVIAGSAILPLCLIAVFMWKKINVKQLETEKGKQTKGTVW